MEDNKSTELLGTSIAYPQKQTGLLVVDPYNDFMTEGGKMYAMTKETADSVGFYENMRKLLPAIRNGGIQVFIVPHHRSHKDDFENWNHVNPAQVISKQMQNFAVDTWGGEWNEEFGPKPGDVIAQQHWAQNGFAGTDLNALLRQHGIEKIILVGFIANSCVEATARFGMELGYHVTLVTDATGAFDQSGMDAARTNSQLYAHASLTTEELINLLPKSQ
jgi:nicotinamidase-related amidase